MIEKKVHSLEHVHFEDTAGLSTLLSSKGYKLNRSRLYDGDSLPEINSFELLLVMGGPMSVHDEDKFDWLKPEKKFIEKCISSGKKIIGICLGAQLLADVLGAKVFKNRYREIGWHNVRQAGDSKKSRIFHGFPEEFTAFQWHGETFDIPSGCIKTSESEACENQSFIYDERIAALQFHLESTEISINNLIKYCGDEIISSPYIQNPEFILKNMHEKCANNEKLLDHLLDNISG
jgi:GMP synthase-like glutamine amidotransferase